MTFPRTILLNDEEDCAWLLSTHLKHNNPPPFASFVLSGNEDCPLQLDLYRRDKPEYNEKPVMVYKLGEGKAYGPDRAEEKPTVTLTHPLIEPVTFTVPDGEVLPAMSGYEKWGDDFKQQLAAPPYSVSIPLDTPPKPLTPALPELDKETEKMLEPSSLDNPLPFPATASQVAAATKPLTLAERLKLKGLK